MKNPAAVKLAVWLYHLAGLLAIIAVVVEYMQGGELKLGLLAAGVFMAVMGEYYRRKGSEP